METIKIYKKNSDNKIIEKEIEQNLLSLYLNIGWKKSIDKPIIKNKEEIKENSKDENI